LSGRKVGNLDQYWDNDFNTFNKHKGVVVLQICNEYYLVCFVGCTLVNIQVTFCASLTTVTEVEQDIISLHHIFVIKHETNLDLSSYLFIFYFSSNLFSRPNQAALTLWYYPPQVQVNRRGSDCICHLYRGRMFVETFSKLLRNTAVKIVSV